MGWPLYWVGNCNSSCSNLGLNLPVQFTSPIYQSEFTSPICDWINQSMIFAKYCFFVLFGEKLQHVLWLWRERYESLRSWQALFITRLTKDNKIYRFKRFMIHSNVNEFIRIEWVRPFSKVKWVLPRDRDPRTVRETFAERCYTKKYCELSEILMQHSMSCLDLMFYLKVGK